jgi:predicted dehydrogenase
MKIALVGCGKIADGHVEQIQRNAELVAVCDREALLAEQLATRYGVARYYDDFEAMLAREHPDVVHITTPPSSHLPLARLALAAGCHLFVEKPLAPSLEEARALVDAARRAGKKLTVGYTYLFDPPALEMRARMNEIGEVVHVESFYGYDLSGDYGSAVLSDASHWVHALPGGGLLFNNIDHLLNKLVEFIDDESPAIQALAYRRHPSGLPDELRVMIGGETVSAFATFSSHIRPNGHFCRVYGTRGSLEVDYVSRTVVSRARPTLPSALGRVLPPFAQAARLVRAGLQNSERFARADFQFFAGLERLIRDFYASIRDDRDPPIAYRDILRIASWMHTIMAQISPPKAHQEAS